VLCRDQLAQIWQYVDLRDEAAAQYLQMVESGIKKASNPLSPAKVQGLINVVDRILEKRQDYDSRRSARLELFRLSALATPEPTMEEALAFEDQEDSEDGDGVTEGNG
jgi:hypothetical protein